MKKLFLAFAGCFAVAAADHNHGYGGNIKEETENAMQMAKENGLDIDTPSWMTGRFLEGETEEDTRQLRSHYFGNGNYVHHLSDQDMEASMTRENEETIDEAKRYLDGHGGNIKEETENALQMAKENGVDINTPSWKTPGFGRFLEGETEEDSELPASDDDLEIPDEENADEADDEERVFEEEDVDEADAEERVLEEEDVDDVDEEEYVLNHEEMDDTEDDRELAEVDDELEPPMLRGYA
eukprot:GHVU01087957.1.p2 GENE.GHVU01087957.1~~GHVU01087957.1.p2  ORF type:complete len:240 (-),score=74.49 GHVU01087957.1:905-1624(-)